MALNTIFGVLEYKDNKFSNEDKASEAIKEFIGRELGITKKIDRQEKLLKAYDDPKEWLNDRLKAYKGLDEAPATAFQRVYIREVASGETDENARKKAMEAARAQYNLDLADVRKKYPKEIVDAFKMKLDWKKAPIN